MTPCTTLFLAMAWAAGTPAASHLRAECRNGQVFLTWEEAETGEGVRYVVRSSRYAMTAENVAQSRVLARLRPGSADDWWQNPETYGTPLSELPPESRHWERRGFVIRPGAPPLNPASGLFVHTVLPEEVGPCYYAVTLVGADGTERFEVEPGNNALKEPVFQQVGEPTPIWQRDVAQQPPPGAGKGLPLHLILHAKRGRGGMDYLAFGDASLGWREGLPFKFGVQVTDEAVVVRPTDRTWIDRLFPEGRDACQRLTPAIHSFWYGYNSHIYDPKAMPTGVPTNYTERRLLYLVRWVQRYYQTDPNRAYVFGSSMGGCGAIAVALRHPEIFAAIRAHVPIVEYDDRGDGVHSLNRVEAENGPLDRICSEGMPLRERLSAIDYVQKTHADLPFLVITNGRQDTSIPWGKNPRFYRALNEARQAFVAAWDNGQHGTCGQAMPPDILRWNDLRQFHRFALNRSYLAFSNGSANEDPGNGDPNDGDLVGTMNRYLTFEDPVEASNAYEVVVRWEGPPDRLPVTVDITPRRRQRFRPPPGTTCTAENRAQVSDSLLQRQTVLVEPDRLLTVRKFQITHPEGNRLRIYLSSP